MDSVHDVKSRASSLLLLRWRETKGNLVHLDDGIFRLRQIEILGSPVEHVGYRLLVLTYVKPADDDRGK